MLFSAFFSEIFANPPKFKQYLYLLKRCKSPIGTNGAPSPNREMSNFRKLFIIVILVVFKILCPSPICKVY